ncbi:hypothetical protein Vadar_033302 [Vaccinium darrowii]|uniref:Uncharacterized protein n=1 Tax=Vaccinium darrowii TaxID=229202 RepID=A0ACB7ZPN1_9ERIC|nr:hypothetical protein Vadar_033302 [Vaccinium darrowii]
MAGASVLPPAEVLLSKRVQEMVLNGEEPPTPYSSKASGEEYEEELMKLKSALHSWGCFQAIGHGISSSFLDKIIQVAREFFEQPMEEKNKYSKTVVEFEGYGADPVPEEGQSLDWSDRLFLNVYPKDLQKLEFWLESPASFRELMSLHPNALTATRYDEDIKMHES